MPSWLNRLETQLVLAFLIVAVLPALVLAATLSREGNRMAEAFISENVEQTAAAYAAGIDLFVERQRGRLRELAESSPDDLEAGVELDRGLVAVWRSDGTGRAGAPPDEWALAACRSLVAQEQRLIHHAGEGHAHEVVVAVGSGPNAVCAQINFTPHQTMLSTQADGLLGGSAYIVDRDGVVVCYAFEDEHPHVPRGEILSPKVVDIAARGRLWSGTVGEGFASFALAEELPWGVWVEVPRQAAFAPFQTALLRGSTSVLLVLGLAAALAVWLGRRLGAPVQRLAAAASRVAAGELGASVPVSGPTEIASLAAEFNAMSKALARSHADLEERVAARTEDLSRARAFSDRLLDTMRQRILVIDVDRRIIRANRAALEAYGDVLGQRCTSVHRTPSGEECVAAVVIRAGEPHRTERSTERDGRLEVLDVDTVPLSDEHGASVGALEIAQDVTELRRIQAQLNLQEKMASVGTLAAGLAHEIGNPLASMSSELEMLERLWDPEDARSALPVLRDQVRRMAGLLRELTEFGRPASDHATRFLAAAVLEDVARLLRHDPRGRRVEISVDAEQTIEVCTSRDRVVQVLVNLGLNALDAVDERGSVFLRASMRDREVRFEVEDDGPGVAEESISRVFEPFFTSKAPGDGTGLGLFVSGRIVENLGGRIELASSPSGACFSVTLPDCRCEGSPK